MGRFESMNTFTGGRPQSRPTFVLRPPWVRLRTGAELEDRPRFQTWGLGAIGAGRAGPTRPSRSGCEAPPWSAWRRGPLGSIPEVGARCSYAHANMRLSPRLRIQSLQGPAACLHNCNSNVPSYSAYGAPATPLFVYLRSRMV